jgi:TctA family transporter
MKRREYIAIMIAYFLSNFLTLALQGIALRSFVLLMRIPLYAMASVIVFYCAIGVFSLNDSLSGMWTLLVFGILGYVMMLLHFPLAPMILGVVLGPVAETNLSRSLATSDDLSQFFTRSWAFVLSGAGSLLGVLSLVSICARPGALGGFLHAGALSRHRRALCS